MKNRKIFMTALILLICCAAFAGMLYLKRNQNHDPITRTGFYLNTVISITIYDSQDTSLLEDCLEICGQYENQFSRTISSSEISRLNSGELADEQGVSHLSAETADLIGKSLAFAELSGGAFDPTIAPVSALWDFTSGEAAVPSDTSIQEKLPLVGYENVSLDGENLTFAKAGMQLDLGAIAKGYIADRIKDYLISRNVKSAAINLGGNVLCIGSKPDGSPFKIGIQQPFADRNTYAAVAAVSDISVVTSGSYERYFEKDGKLYHHILNPATGYPCENGLTSVTILSESSVDGDGLSTSCFALGLEKGMALIDSLPDTEAMFITEDGQTHCSDGFSQFLAG